MTLDFDGFEMRRGMVGHDAIMRLRIGMTRMMEPFSESGTVCGQFADIGARHPGLKQTLYGLFSKLGEIPAVLDHLREFVFLRGFHVWTVQSWSVFCVEPNDDRLLFLPHQDLKDRVSLRSLMFWIPLNVAPGIGGISVWRGSHLQGPQKHVWRTGPEYCAGTDRSFVPFKGAAARKTPHGALVLPEEKYEVFERMDVVDWEIGDVLVMTPYTVHASIPNRGDAMRWTLVIKIEDALGNPHWAENASPFPVAEYIPAWDGAGA